MSQVFVYLALDLVPVRIQATNLRLDWQFWRDET